MSACVIVGSRAGRAGEGEPASRRSLHLGSGAGDRTTADSARNDGTAAAPGSPGVMETMRFREPPHRHVHCCDAGMLRFTMHCARCGVLIASRARHVGPVEISVMEHHLLTCRPLDTVGDHHDLLRRFRITPVEADGREPSAPPP